MISFCEHFLNSFDDSYEVVGRLNDPCFKHLELGFQCFLEIVDSCFVFLACSDSCLVSLWFGAIGVGGSSRYWSVYFLNRFGEFNLMT